MHVGDAGVCNGIDEEAFTRLSLDRDINRASGDGGEVGGEDRGALKLTINQFYRVNGDSTQNRGVESDVVLPSLLDHMDLGESSLDNALAFDQIPAAPYTPLRMSDKNMIAQLRESSRKRIAGDDEFKDTQKDIQKYLDRKNRKSITLNEAKLREERDADKTDDEKEDELPEADPDGPIFPEGHYNDEILTITADYNKLLKELRTARTN